MNFGGKIGRTGDSVGGRETGGEAEPFCQEAGKLVRRIGVKCHDWANREAGFVCFKLAIEAGRGGVHDED